MLKRKKKSIVWTLSIDDFRKLVNESSTLTEIAKYFNLNPKGGNLNTIKRRLKEDNIDYSHITLGLNSNKGKNFEKEKQNINELLIENYEGSTTYLKKRIIKENIIPYICSDCGNNGIWNDKKISLQLHHKNGHHKDCRIENMIFLCPNCHSQTDGFAGGKNKIEKTKKERHYVQFYPTTDELKELVKTNSNVSISKIYNVSETTVRKWRKKYNV